MKQMTDVYATPASEQTLQRVVAGLKERNIEAVVVDNRDDARKLVMERLPEGGRGAFRQVEDAAGSRNHGLDH